MHITDAAPAESSRGASRAKVIQTAFRVFSALAALLLTVMSGIAMWARCALTPVEFMVGLHASMLARGEGLYYDLNHYPFTVAAYGPIFYTASAGLHLIGLPLYQAGRILSIGALLIMLWLGWRIVLRLTGDPNAAGLSVLIAATTSTLVYWGTAGQVDMVGCCFSVAAFERFLAWQEEESARRLVEAGLLVAAAVFTKQTFVASGLTLSLCLLVTNRRAAFLWIPSLAAVGLAAAAILNAITHGAFLQNAVLANLNPFRSDKFLLQINYFGLANIGLIAVFLASFGFVRRKYAPLLVYLALAAMVWLATAPKLGSDLNYQIEMTYLLCLAAGCLLSSAAFVPQVLGGGRSLVTLLQLPLALHLVLNLLISSRTTLERVLLEPMRRQQVEQLRPFLDPSRGRVLASDYDSLLQRRGTTEVETLIYTLLVDAGASDPRPVLNDLQARRFDVVVLNSNASGIGQEPGEVRSLPAQHLAALRRNYHLVKHIDGPFFDGLFVYEPNNH